MFKGKRLNNKETKNNFAGREAMGNFHFAKRVLFGVCFDHFSQTVKTITLFSRLDVS